MKCSLRFKPAPRPSQGTMAQSEVPTWTVTSKVSLEQVKTHSMSRVLRQSDTDNEWATEASGGWWHGFTGRLITRRQRRLPPQTRHGHCKLVICPDSITDSSVPLPGPSSGIVSREDRRYDWQSPDEVCVQKRTDYDTKRKSCVGTRTTLALFLARICSCVMLWVSFGPLSFCDYLRSFISPLSEWLETISNTYR